MSWDDINKNSNNEEGLKHHNNKLRAEAASLAKHYANCFDGPSGEAVLTDLMNNFVIHNNVSQDADNYADRVIYSQGEKGSIMYIVNQIERAKIL